MSLSFTFKAEDLQQLRDIAEAGLTVGIIHSTNEIPNAFIDPRIQLAQILGASEASDGILKFAIQGEVEPFCLWNNRVQDQSAPKR